ncbi:MAG: RagB/SusD family nutrient uptake outer membrane protein [Bacteroidota bacterium]
MKKVYLYSFVILAIISSSCEDFLDLEPPTAVTPEAFLTTEQGINEATIGIYNHFRGLYSGQQWVFGEFRSDNTSFQFNAQDRGGAGLEALDEFIANSSSGNIANYWNTSYQGVFRTTNILESIDQVEFTDEASKMSLAAEARFFRAFYYFNLVRLYGDVPLVDATIDGVDETEIFAAIDRSPVADIYNQIIIPDLIFAKANLPAPGDEAVGRASEGAARMLLADVYMTIPNYEMAVLELDTIVNDLNYELLPDYEQAFNPDFKNNSESMFELQYAFSARQPANFYANWVPFNSGTDITPNPAGSRAGRNQPTADLVDAYEDGDLRRDISITYYNVNDTDSVVFINKYNYPFPGPGGQDINFPVYRYAEALLFYSEALNETSPLSDGAVLFVNRVRNRAGLPPLVRGQDFNTQEDLRELIWNERRIELAFESKRWFDLLRSDNIVPNRALTTMQAHGQNQANEKTTLNPGAYDNIRILLAIPAIEASLYGYEQNPGWD